MKIVSRLARAALTTGLAASLLAGSGWFTPASAAPTYWTFKSKESGGCLIGSSTGKVWAGTCNGSASQQWDWIGTAPEFNQLKNRATGNCLTTDWHTYNNALWQAPCNSGDAGQRYSYEENYIGAGIDFFWRLRTSPSGSVAVYNSDITYAGIADKYYRWTGTHT